jgi:hypothetical protein
MALPNSGIIALSDFNTELQTSGQISLNDAAVRDLIGKASGAQNAMNEYYGASSSDAVETYVFTGNDWVTAFHGSAEGYFITGVERRSDDPFSYPHKWPMADGETEPHALDAPFVAQIKSDTALNDIYPSWCTNSSVRGSGRAPNLGGGNNGSTGNPNTLTGVQPLQRVKPGVRTFNGSYSLSNSGYDGSPFSIEVSIHEYETMTPSGGGFATVGGGKRRQQLAYNSKNGGINGSMSGTFNKTLTTTYEWVYLEMKVITQFNRGTTSDVGVDSIT